MTNTKGAKMCQEVFQIAMSMDLKSVEMQLAIQCAPLITGARISNMLMIDSADESAMRVILRYHIPGLQQGRRKPPSSYSAGAS